MSDQNKENGYFLEGHTVEIQRLTLQHEVLKTHIGSLILAPVDLSKLGLRILDSATADGLWLRDLQTSLPGENVYVGTDIVESYFPPKSRWPSNFTLQIQSITKKWPKAFEESFDLVHQRFALPAAGKDGVRDALHGLVSLVKPGGWIQFVEADHSIFTGPAMGELFKLVEEVFGAMNVGHDHAKDVKGMLEEEGLEVVEERIVDVPLGAKNPSPDMGRKSAIAFAMGADGIVGAARHTSTCTFSQERLDSLMSRIERELKEEGGIHRLYIVWGRRPFA